MSIKLILFTSETCKNCPPAKIAIKQVAKQHPEIEIEIKDVSECTRDIINHYSIHGVPSLYIVKNEKIHAVRGTLTVEKNEKIHAVRGTLTVGKIEDELENIKESE